ncbi:MAG: proteasome accessory factor PafA2 family protein [Gemmatimonadetes bacterium]|jgi:proteasome accessory factor A|nr:proteasome accessory factor PafA2 family protein [Gemmatimonadota bacterium]MBT4613028.1 proteasome accessory factor PafA2 family protein [Gemmatimonadota bacterium]MBT5060285.1 proteasome accessory factor PafA2 family protein [Gemmatimonadota bacterium]MBT5146198.1 proteasome accessory factor PafA2 family protein [Gemmatimonadota bacterium]MBT5587547.1 proteasome accessory factor PafA2 family protein [Gemmatimonadota bacterium]
MRNRIYGLEIEFGCMPPDTDPFLSPDFVSAKAKDTVFYREGLGILDIHYRGRDEPPGNGGFLFNGGRFYLDMGHVEYATPECRGLFDLVAADRAGEVIVQRALDQLGLAQEGGFFKNNIDHYTGATFGCHENYLVRRDVPFSQVLLPAILPFFVTRQIFAGSGRVGCHTDVFEYGGAEETDVSYQISQRADHIVTEIYQWIQFSRAIINTRDEPLADVGLYRRLHLLVGDSNMSEYATALKVGTTALMLELMEERIIPEVRLLDPVQAIRDISRDLTYRWEVQLEDGSWTTALEIQRQYLQLADQYLRGKDDEGDWVLDEWRFVLNGLTHDPMSLMDRIDWVTKKWLLDAFVADEGLEWNDPWLQSLDLEYHNLNPEKGLYYDLRDRGLLRRVVDDEHVNAAIVTPPQDTRAKARSQVMRCLSGQKARYVIDWDSIYVEDDKYLSLDDPFLTYEAEATAFVDEVERPPDPETLAPEKSS